MSTVVTQADFCATTVTQADFSNATSTVSADFRRAWITAEKLPGLERNSAQNHFDHQTATLSPATASVITTTPSTLTTQLTTDHDDEVALHPLSNQVNYKLVSFVGGVSCWIVIL